MKAIINPYKQIFLYTLKNEFASESKAIPESNTGNNNQEFHATDANNPDDNIPPYIQDILNSLHKTYIQAQYTVRENTRKQLCTMMNGVQSTSDSQTSSVGIKNFV